MKKALVLGLVLLLGVTCVAADTKYATNLIVDEDLTVGGSFTSSSTTYPWAISGTTFIGTFSTSAIFYSPIFRVGYDSGAWLSYSIADTTGSITVTQTGSSKAYTHTASGGFNFNDLLIDSSGNASITDSTNAGSIYMSTYNIVYTQTDSAVTVCTLPANAYVTDVKVMTTVAFDDSGTVTCDIGWSGTLEGYAGDLDIKSADGWAYADVYTGFGVSVGGTARDILVSIADQNNDGTAGAATVYIEWTMGAPGSL